MTVRYLTARQIAERLGVSVVTVAKWRRSGYLPEPDAYVGVHPGWAEETVRAITRPDRRRGYVAHADVAMLVAELCAAGWRKREIAAHVGVSEMAVSRWSAGSARPMDATSRHYDRLVTLRDVPPPRRRYVSGIVG